VTADVPLVLTLDDPAATVATARREAYRIYQALPPYPALIRGRFDPVRWAADPHRRTDYYDERDADRPGAAAGARCRCCNGPEG
jgi:hypothetical protein